ncbi:myc protein-like [Teleopsis dalmanni]|uniref:myc protein-like n=1 Tax=Teleopsis dalmanni TaxID=139649 RepID=UPI0018CEFEF4|nr:myc protein-like [Teleopsis dalmanni]
MAPRIYEEIDVVTIGDKKLPTNPSDKDRRALQNKVAYKISNRMVKTVNGLRTIPPRRSGSVEYPYTPASSNSPVKSLANSRYPSQLLMTVLSDGTTAPINIINDKTRKRVNGNVLINTSNNADYSLPPNKKYRGKKSKNGSVSTTTTSINGTANGALRRHYSLDEAADTIEKRNLHNDMERQRRIGLKNLFEALKKQIPSIKDKERAPKVNILREAAKLCDALVVEDRRLAEQRAVLMEQLKKRQEQKLILLEQLRKRHDLKPHLIIHRD